MGTRSGWTILYKSLFVLSPMIVILTMIIAFLPSSQGLVKVEQNLDSLMYFSGVILFIFVCLYILYIALGRAVIAIPLLMAIFMAISNWGKAGESLFTFYVFQLPLFITTSIYCVGFFINDTFIHKKEENMEETPSTLT